MTRTNREMVQFFGAVSSLVVVCVSPTPDDGSEDLQTHGGCAIKLEHRECSERTLNFLLGSVSLVNSIALLFTHLIFEFSNQLIQTLETLSLSMATDASTPDNLDDYSPSATVIKFDHPIPLLRGPLPAGASDDPSAGPYVLAFRDTQAWSSSFIACERKIVEQCEEGARIGCAISASNKCKPPWWKVLVGPKPSDLKEREVCEVREMEDCFAAAKEKCVGFARDKCLVPFRDARIRVKVGVLKPKEAVKLICFASMPERSIWARSGLGYRCLLGSNFRETNCKASELLGFDDSVQRILGERQQDIRK